MGSHNMNKELDLIIIPFLFPILFLLHFPCVLSISMHMYTYHTYIDAYSLCNACYRNYYCLLLYRKIYYISPSIFHLFLAPEPSVYILVGARYVIRLSWAGSHWLRINSSMMRWDTVGESSWLVGSGIIYLLRHNHTFLPRLIQSYI